MDEDTYRAVTEITNSVVETEDQSIEDIQDQIEELLRQPPKGSPELPPV